MSFGEASGDRGAVEELLVRHLPGLRSYVRLKAGRLVRARENESDVVQSVCREVLQEAAAFRYGGEAGFRHWLYATAMRKILDKHKRHTAGRRDVRREAAPPSESGDGAALADLRFASPSGAAIGAEQFERLAAAFDELPEDYAEVILLSRVVGLPRKDVAAAMARTEASVRNLLHRGLAELARRYDGG
jgi:RNA polymerase sigma-70 factor (subfamily 1)